MVGRPEPGGVKLVRALGLAVMLASAGVCADTPIALQLREVNARKFPDFNAVYLGKRVLVHGVVNAERFRFPQFTVLAIQNKQEGAVLSVAAGDLRLDHYKPGDELSVTGTVAFMAGMTTIQPETIELVGQQAAPKPVNVSPQEVQNLQYLGRLVHVKGKLANGVTDSTAGAQIFIESNCKIFEPRPQYQPQPSFPGFNAGDDIEATGVEFQYCPAKPYNSG
ncbi:MAG TPA: hypothetical protein VFB00_01900, partial [Terriglobales bacterium]|nr:hypothetical protein [Terriglobales bacterium]